MEAILIKAAQFILSLSILIILHEFGHFLPAKLFKTRVEKFYLFFNPWFSLVKKKIGDTEYGIGWLPLGGYVKISGMVDESMDTDYQNSEPQPYEFRSKPAWQRLIIMIGGVVVNVIVAIVIYAGIMAYYGEEYLPTKNVEYGIVADSMLTDLGFENGDKIISVNGVEVENFLQIPMEIILQQGGEVQIERDGRMETVMVPESAISTMIANPSFMEPRTPYIIQGFTETSLADEAGLQAGDQIVGLNDQSLVYFDQYLEEVPKHKGETVKMAYMRNGAVDTVQLVVPEEGSIGIFRVTDMSSIFTLESKTYGLLEAIPAGVSKTYSTLKNYLRQFKLIANPETEAYKSVGGFLTIGSQFPDTWDWQFFWGFTAFLSIMLAFLNILPIPALDGGHVVFVLYEMISRRKPNEKVLEYAQIAGFVILIALMLFANGNDIIKYVLN